MASYGQGMAGVKILEVSNSRRSIILDRGTLEGIKIGQKARLILQEGVDYPKMTLTAFAEAIKVYSKYSFWYLRKIERPLLIKSGGKFILAREDEMLSGRREYILKQKKIILRNGESLNSYLEESKNDFPSDLLFKGTKYVKGEEMVVTVPTFKHDIETTNYDAWIGKSSEYDDKNDEVSPRYHTKQVGKVVDGKMIKQKYRKKMADSMIDGTIKKTNEMDQGLEGFYKDQEKDDGGIRERITGENLYQKFKMGNKDEEFVDPAALRKIEKGGPLWSADLSDAELRRFFIESGIEGEVNRQKMALEERAGHEITFRYFSGVARNTTAKDVNHRGTNYSLGLGYEFHLANTSKMLKFFSFELTIERGVNYYDIGGVNGRFEVGTMKGFFNWYFYNNPTSLEKYLFYLSGGLGRGNATLTADSLSNEYLYQVLIVPSWRVGLKYRFKAGDTKNEFIKVGFGVNFLFVTEYSSFAVADNLRDDIKSRFSANNSKLSIGLSVYF